MRHDPDFPTLRHPASGQRITGARSPGATRDPGSQALSFDAPEPGRVGLFASLMVHGAIATAALVAWRIAPIQEPPEVVPVEIVTDVPSGIGSASQTQAATDTGEPEAAGPAPEAAAPAPPETAEAQATPEAAPPAPPAPPVPAPPPPKAPPPKAPPPPPPPPAARPAPAPPPPAPPPPPRKAESTRPPPPAPPPPPRPAQPRPQASQQRTPAPPPSPPAPARRSPPPPPAAPAGTSGTSGSVADDFSWDSAAATQRASGADSGGRRTPQMKGQDGVRSGGSAAGGGQVLGGDLGAAILAQVRNCWAIPENPEAARMVVTVRFRLTLEGRLRGDVELVNPRTRPSGNTPATIAVDRALGAVRQCVSADGRSGYQLPRERYDEWSDITINIGLRTMQP